MSRMVDAHNNGDCSSFCPICEVEDSLEAARIFERVHIHPPYRPTCNERRTPDGMLRGACVNDDGSERWFCDRHKVWLDGDCAECDDDLTEATRGYGKCTACGAIEAKLVEVTGTHDFSHIGESANYPTGYGCEFCA